MKDMNQDECLNWREAWLAGELDESMMTSSAGHPSRCADCRGFVADARRIDQGLDRLPLVLPGPQRWAEWERGVFAGLVGARRASARPWLAPLQAAAALALFALLAAWGLSAGRDESADIYVRILELERRERPAEARALRAALAARYPGSVAERLAARSSLAPMPPMPPMFDMRPALSPHVVAHYREAEDVIVREHVALATLPADQRRLMAAEIYLVLKGDPAQARALYEGLLSEFPHSRYAAVARRQLDALRTP